MEIAVSSASWIADLGAYLRTRFPPRRFVPLALFLALAAGASLWYALLALPWLLQFRLADDLADRERDRLRHPDRILVRAAPLPFRVFLGLLTAGNVALAAWWLPPPRWAEYLVLTGLFLAWYALPRHRLPPLAAGLPVLLKYPAFVHLLREPGAANGWALVLVGACFVAHEFLHDPQLQAEAGGRGMLVAALALMTATAAVPLGWGWLLPGIGVLLLVYGRRRAGGTWAYLIFLVGCGWILAGYHSGQPR
jgi:hypothetical protein